MKKITCLLVLLIILIGLSKNADALYKPYLKIEADREAYQQKVSHYSSENQQKLTELSKQIVEINNRRVSDLSQQIDAQGKILEEYQYRQAGESTPQIEKARYWLTYAHEAVAFQLVQVYIFNLTQEKNIKAGASATVNKFESDLNSARTKVINSLNIIKGLVKSP